MKKSLRMSGMGGTKLDKQYTKLKTIKPKNLLQKVVQSQPKFMFKGSMKVAEATTNLMNKALPKSNKISFFKMKKFSGFGNESPAKMKGDPNDMRAKVFKSGEFKDIISKKPASAGQKAVRGFSNAAKTQRKATAKIGRKVATKIGAKFLGPVGAGLAIKDAYGTYKDIKKGMKPGKAARKNFLGF